jgi:hypothetical protein
MPKDIKSIKIEKVLDKVCDALSILDDYWEDLKEYKDLENIYDDLLDAEQCLGVMAMRIKNPDDERLEDVPYDQIYSNWSNR